MIEDMNARKLGPPRSKATFQLQTVCAFLKRSPDTATAEIFAGSS